MPGSGVNAYSFSFPPRTHETGLWLIGRVRRHVLLAAQRHPRNCPETLQHKKRLLRLGRRRSTRICCFSPLGAKEMSTIREVGLLAPGDTSAAGHVPYFGAAFPPWWAVTSRTCVCRMCVSAEVNYPVTVARPHRHSTDFPGRPISPALFPGERLALASRTKEGNSHLAGTYYLLLSRHYHTIRGRGSQRRQWFVSSFSQWNPRQSSAIFGAPVGRTCLPEEHHPDAWATLQVMADRVWTMWITWRHGVAPTPGRNRQHRGSYRG